MQPDHVRVADTRAWLRRAEEDLQAADALLDPGHSLTGLALFHAQQSAEKALKAFLVWHDRPFRKTHDLAELGQQCIEVDPSLEEVCRRAESMTVYAWIFRYPGESEVPAREEVEESLDLASALVQGILSRIPVEAQPST
ncbi:MAG: HEPN domain-containing protein [Actinomycetota bacterium]